jgi:hypothetical protein
MCYHKWDGVSIYKVLYIRPPTGTFSVFMTNTNLAYWGMIVVPVGLLICFGPALWVWLREELRAGAAEKQERENNIKR